MATYRNTNPEGDLFEKVRRYISGLGYYIKPPGGIPASDLANYVLPSAVTDYSVGRLNYTKNLGTVTTIKMNNAVVPQTEGVVDLGAIQEKIDTDHKLSGDFIIDGLVNKVINVKPDWNAASDSETGILNKPTLATVATSGSYNDLSNKPTIPDVSNMEVTTNKVTSLSSSSTHTQYPSAKATYTYINAMLGDIETLLSNI